MTIPPNFPNAAASPFVRSVYGSFAVGRLAVSPAAVSRHPKVLRETGLLTTSRTGPAVRHGLTPLGHRLLDARES